MTDGNGAESRNKDVLGENFMFPPRVIDDIHIKAQLGRYRMRGMALFTLLPLGILQVNAAMNNGYWFARSAEFMQQPIVDMLVWMRVPGDTLFSVGALALAWFVLRLWIAPKSAPVPVDGATESAR